PFREPISALKFFDHPATYFNFNNHVGFETPPDLWGELQVGLDVRGCPATTTPNPGRLLYSDHPYELDFSAKIPSGAAVERSRDRLFDVGEMATILLRNDLTSGDVAAGAGTQGRISQLVNTFAEMPSMP